MSRLLEGCHWLGRLLLDLIIIRVWRRTLGVFKIAKVIRKPKGSSVTRGQLTPYPGQKDEEVSYQLRSKRSVRVSELTQAGHTQAEFTQE